MRCLPVLLTLSLFCCASGFAAGGLVFENTFGGSGVTNARAIALDSLGNIYVVGTTNSADFAVLKPLQSKSPSTLGSVFVSKWSPDGSQLLYSTYLGGSLENSGTGIAVDSAGNAYVTGYTSSPDFPVTSNAFQPTLAGSQNAFVTKLSPDGSHLIYSTFLGGAGAAQANAIAVDSGGNVIVTGQTLGNTFPVTANAFESTPVSVCVPNIPYSNLASAGDAFVTKIAADGASLEYSTLLGGSCATFGLAVALDGSGNAWVSGYTSSPDFPVTLGGLQQKFGGGGYDGYFAQFTAGGSLAYASYLGGNGSDSVTGITLDASGDVYIAGVSNGAFIGSLGILHNTGGGCLNPNLGPNALTYAGVPFLAKLAPNQGSVSGFTYLDGACAENVVVAVDSSGSPWVAGSLEIGAQPSLPTVSPIRIGGAGFVTKFTSSLPTQTLFSTYFDPINALALDSSGAAYLAGAIVVTMPQSAFVAKIDSTPPPISLDQVLTTGSVVIEPNLQLGVAPGEVLRLMGRGIGPTTVTPGFISSGFVATSVAGVEVTFGGVPAPLLSVSAGEIDCVAPFETANQGGATTIQVQYNGVQSNPVQMNVLPSAVEVLAVLNPDGTLNSPSNPTPLGGSPMAMYLAGVGQTNPPSQDGRVNQAPFALAGALVQIEYYVCTGIPFCATETTERAQITYAGAAPGLIAGILQVNFLLPAETGLMNGVSVDVPGSSTNVPVSTFFINPNP